MRPRVTMRNSDIIVPKSEQTASVTPVDRIVKAFRSERTQQEITEVELNRTKIVMIDEDGNIKKVPLVAEH